MFDIFRHVVHELPFMLEVSRRLALVQMEVCVSTSRPSIVQLKCGFQSWRVADDTLFRVGTTYQPLMSVCFPLVPGSAKQNSSSIMVEVCIGQL